MIKSELVKRLAKIHPYLYQRDSERIVNALRRSRVIQLVSL